VFPGAISNPRRFPGVADTPNSRVESPVPKSVGSKNRFRAIEGHRSSTPMVALDWQAMTSY